MRSVSQLWFSHSAAGVQRISCTCFPTMPNQIKLDTQSLFLLPFEETAQCTFEIPMDGPPTSNKMVGADRSDPKGKQYFEYCVLTRLESDPLENGNVSPKHSGQFHFKAGQFMLMRPTDNSHRPAVGKAVAFWQRKDEKRALVQWCYRAEDLSETPTEANGEDEVFMTHHFDNIDVAAIAGRCSVDSYRNWICTVAEEKSKQKSVMSTESKVLNEENDNLQAENKPEPEQIDELSDTDSCFWDNYSSSSVHYYCKYFYDPIMHMFITSDFEDETVEPYDEINALKRADAADRKGNDNEFANASGSSSDDDSESMELVSEDGTENSEVVTVDDDVKTTKQRKKRKRVGQRSTKTVPREKGNVASQFALPSDLGTPQQLPCRDTEKEHVRRFLEDAINGSADGGQSGSRCLYISGVPGTGKTATVREIVRDLVAQRAAGEMAQFEVIEVNGMSLPDPNLVYTELYTAITGKRGVAPMHAAQLLEKRFSNTAADSVQKVLKRGAGVPGVREKGKCVILVLDEMDVLVSRKQKVLYDVLDWPTRKNARMAVIGIANTMDLPERMLPRLGSRLGVNRLCYPPYTSAQLGTILEMKIAELGNVSFSQPALKLCAAKIGAVSGDVRRALELCRRASELIGEGECVKPQHIIEALSDISGGSRLKALGNLSLFERLFLVSAVCLAKTHGSFEMEETSTVGFVANQALEDAQRLSELFVESGIPTVYELEEVCWRLASQRMILIEKAAVFRNSRVIVNVAADDCAFGLRDCPLSTKILDGCS